MFTANMFRHVRLISTSAAERTYIQPFLCFRITFDLPLNISFQTHKSCVPQLPQNLDPVVGVPQLGQNFGPFPPCAAGCPCV